MSEKQQPTCPRCGSALIPQVRGIEMLPHYYSRPDGVDVAVCRCPRCVIDIQVPFDQFPEPEPDEKDPNQWQPSTDNVYGYDPDKT